MGRSKTEGALYEVGMVSRTSPWLHNHLVNRNPPLDSKTHTDVLSIQRQLQLIAPISNNRSHKSSSTLCRPLHGQSLLYCLEQSFEDQGTTIGTHSLQRRANARNVSFRISLRWPIHIINPVDKTKLFRRPKLAQLEEDVLRNR